MKSKFNNIRTFIGAKNFSLTREFYREFGFTESVISSNLSLFTIEGSLSFYLQDYYIEDWINNSMMVLEVEDVNICWREITSTGLDKKYKGVRFTPIKTLDWGRECFMHDPSGVLWHFCQFNK